MIRSQVLNKVFTAAFFLYPLLAFLGLRYFDVVLASAVLSVILVLRLTLFRQKDHNSIGRVLDVVWWVMLINNLLNLYFKSDLAIKIYPVLMSISFFGIFAHSLWIKRPLIERFARMYETHLSEKRLAYIKKLTVIWTVWLFINTVLSAYTAGFSTLKVWAIYNNVIFYIVGAVLLGADFLYRKLIFDRHDKMKVHDASSES